ncbi:MAG: hypothetical protein P8X42_10740, partial [Calditrichaceae bacterium]
MLTISVDSSNNIWAGTLGLDILKYDKKEDNWKIQKIVRDDTTKQPLTESTVLGMTADGKGHIWAGSFISGLIRYDDEIQGFRKVEFANPDEAPDFSQTDNAITYLFTDVTGILWFTTRNGIYKYNPATKLIKTIKEYTTNKSSFFNYFNCITEDLEGNIWITNHQRGILKFEGISDEYKEIKLAGQHFNREHISDLILTYMLVDKTGILWFGTTGDGLLKYDPKTAPFRLYQHDPENPQSLSSNHIFSLFESKVHPGKIYVGT